MKESYVIIGCLLLVLIGLWLDSIEGLTLIASVITPAAIIIGLIYLLSGSWRYINRIPSDESASQYSTKGIVIIQVFVSLGILLGYGFGYYKSAVTLGFNSVCLIILAAIQLICAFYVTKRAKWAWWLSLYILIPFISLQYLSLWLLLLPVMLLNKEARCFFGILDASRCDSNAILLSRKRRMMLYVAILVGWIAVWYYVTPSRYPSDEAIDNVIIDYHKQKKDMPTKEELMRFTQGMTCNSNVVDAYMYLNSNCCAFASQDYSVRLLSITSNCIFETGASCGTSREKLLKEASRYIK